MEANATKLACDTENNKLYLLGWDRIVVLDGDNGSPVAVGTFPEGRSFYWTSLVLNPAKQKAYFNTTRQGTNNYQLMVYSLLTNEVKAYPLPQLPELHYPQWCLRVNEDDQLLLRCRDMLYQLLGEEIVPVGKLPLYSDLYSEYIFSTVATDPETGVFYALKVPGSGGAWVVEISDPTSIEKVAGAQAGLEMATYPNPFNPECYIPVNVKGKRQNVKCKIYNILGQLVREIECLRVQDFKGSRVYWDGRDSRGLEVPSGVYFYEVAGKGVRRMVVLK
jgi:hypothetical protein